MRCGMNFKEQERPGSVCANPVLRSRSPGAGLKENVMRVSMLALAAILACAAVPVSAQTVIDVEGQKVAPSPVPERGKAQPPGQVQDQSQESLPTVPPGRFTFSRVDNGFLRLDNDSGQVAYCSAYGRGWTCHAASENHPALDAEIAGLQDDVTALKKLATEIAALQDGVACRRQLMAAGCAPADLERMLRRRELTRVLPGVFVDHTGVPT